MNYDIWHLFGPISWPVWLWLLALGARWRGRDRMSVRCWFLGGLWGLLMIASPLGHLLIRPLEMKYAVPTHAGPVDGIIVLTGAERLKLSTHYQQPVLNEAGERLMIAGMLQRQNPNARLVVVGGVQEKGTVRDIDVARQIFLGLGIPAEKLLLVGKTKDTFTNAAATKHFITPGGRWLLVTSAAHMPRAMACYSKLGVRPVPYPVDFRGRPDVWKPLFMPGTLSNLAAFDLATHEWVGLLYYRITGKN